MQFHMYKINIILCVKPGNKNQMLGTLDDFEFVVEYASMIPLDTVSEIS